MDYMFRDLKEKGKTEKTQDKTRISKNTKGYGYKYTDLAGIHEYLEERGIGYYQEIEKDENGQEYIVTIPVVDGKELPSRKGCKVVDAPLANKSNPAQEYGSALTYARRYSLLMAFGLATEDDDAESLTRKKTKSKKRNEENTVKGITKEQYIELIKFYTDDELIEIAKADDVEEAKNKIAKTMNYKTAEALIKRKRAELAKVGE